MAFFYLGAHRGRWLEQAQVPLFISYRTLAKYRRGGDHFPKGLTSWALDSGGFTELSQYGKWTVDPDDYGGAVYRFMEDVGPPVFCAPQDYMCEPWILKKTGLTVPVHHELTIESVQYLREHFPHAPWIPVLQGWRLEDYLIHLAMYEAAGFDLAAEPLVGLGSVCRRQSTAEIGAIVSALHARGLRLHGFGVKRAGLAKYGHLLKSADSLAWSYTARASKIRLPGCEHRGPCNNCLRYALKWREETIEAMNAPQQFALPLEMAF
ncbi:hypothetical protein SUDANB95_07868 (plasmid) [Actinosynnema sp. ALI-1.44]